jgi:hypothetical protein
VLTDFQTKPRDYVALMAFILTTCTAVWVGR